LGCGRVRILIGQEKDEAFREYFGLLGMFEEEADKANKDLQKQEKGEKRWE